MIMKFKQAINYFLIFSLSCSYYVSDIIKKLELRLVKVIVLDSLNTKFGQAQTSVSKIDILKAKITRINPY